MSADVFISYAASDKPIADAVCALLEGRGIRCWIAPRDIQAGRSWSGAITEAIRDTRAMVVILSREANESPHVIREVERAVSDGDFIVPFRIEDVNPSEDMELLISTSHWLDALTPPLEQHIQSLATSLESLLTTRPPEESSRLARRALLQAAKHMEEPAPAAALPSTPARRSATRWLLGAGLLVAAVAAAGFAYWGLGWGVAPALAPRLVAPELGGSVIGPALVYEWSYDAVGRSGLRFEIERRVDSLEDPLVELFSDASWTEDRPIDGLIRWRVRAIWDGEDGAARTSPWSPERTVIYYRNSMIRIETTGVVHLAATEDAIRSLDERNQPTGFEIEFLRAALRDHLAARGIDSLHLTYEVIPWGDAFFESLDEAEFDVMVGGISIRPGREVEWNVRFTEALYEYRQALVHGPGQALCFGAETSTPCRIAAKAGTTNEELALRIARLHPHVEVQLFDERSVYVKMGMAVVNGDCELVLMDQPYARDLISDRFERSLAVTLVDESVIEDPPIERIGIATRKADGELRKLLNEAIKTKGQEIQALLQGFAPNEEFRPPRG